MNLIINEKAKKLIESHIDELDNMRCDNLIYEALAYDVLDDVISVLEGLKYPIPYIFTDPPCRFTIDTEHMPPYLKNAHFVIWVDRFEQMIKKIGLPPRILKSLNVVFSCEEKTKRYGSLSIEELKDIIRATWNVDTTVEDVLKRINSKEDLRALIQELVHVLNSINPHGIGNEPENLYRYLNELEFDEWVLGEYINSKESIVLYIKNIEKVASENGNTAARECERVFIHELFHAYHYSEDDTELTERCDYTAKVVKESLASAFEWAYCKENKINGADEIKASWKKNSVLYYPYAAASDLLMAIKGSSLDYCLDSKKFVKIFDISLRDMDLSLRTLVSSFDFYDIKNAVSVRLKKVRSKASYNDLKSAFYELMKNDAIGIIAQREIPSIIKKKRYLIGDLLDQNYCYITFNMTSYPVLSTAPMKDAHGYSRSYKEPIQIGNKKYYLYSQWQTRHLQLLLDWIWNNR